MDRPFAMNPNPMTEPDSTVKKAENSNEGQNLQNFDKKQKQKLNQELINYEATYDKGHPIPPQQLPPEIQRAKLD